MRAFALMFLLLVQAAACSRSTEAGARDGTSAVSELRKACGRKLVLQTDWFPDPTHGGAYQLIGAEGRTDKERGRYSGEIVGTGVELEIRAGGPYLGGQNVSSLMYQHREIFMGYVATEAAVRFAQDLPTVAVFAPLATSPQALMWDPSRHSFTSLADMGKTNVTVLYSEGSLFVDYLVARGLIRQDQLDSSYDGSPSRFVVEGDIVQQIYATVEPYQYRYDLPQWNKPVDFLLISTSGYDPYVQTLSVRPETLKTRKACLQRLVPLMQQAQIDYIRNPTAVNEALMRIARELSVSPRFSRGGLGDAVKKMVNLEIVANGVDGVFGSFDMERLRRVLGVLQSIYTADRVRAAGANVTPEQIVTNEFLDPNIHL